MIANQTDAVQQAKRYRRYSERWSSNTTINEEVRSNEDRVKDLYENLIKPMIDELKELSSLKPIFDELILQAQVKNDLSLVERFNHTIY